MGERPYFNPVRPPGTLGLEQQSPMQASPGDPQQDDPVLRFLSSPDHLKELQTPLQPYPGFNQLPGGPGTPYQFGQTEQQQLQLAAGYDGVTGTPGPSQGYCFPGLTMQGSEAPDYLFSLLGTIEQRTNNPGQFGFTTNFVDERKPPKHASQTYSQLLDMLLVGREGDKPPEKTRVVFWTREKLPANARIRIVVVSVDKDERKNAITMCANHQQEWNGGAIPIPHYTIPTESASTMCHCLPQHPHHPVLVIPVEYFQKREENHLMTGEDGYNYTGEFYFPCNTSHLKLKKMKSVLLVAALELIEGSRYMHYGVTTVEVRVCGSPGRDKKELEKKGGSLPDRGIDNSDSEVCSSDGIEPPSKKMKMMTTEASEAASSSSGVTSTVLPAPEVGVSSGGDVTATADLTHVKLEEWRQELLEVLAAEREQREEMTRRVVREELERFFQELRAGGKGADEQPPS